MHGIADVGRHQARGDIQAVVTQLSDPAREETKRQGVRRRNLDNLALPAFKMMQMAENFAQLVDNRAGSDQEQLPRSRQLDGCARAVDQGQAECRLQAANAPAESRLGHKTTLGSLGKAASGGQRTEVFQPFALKVHRKLSKSMHQNGTRSLSTKRHMRRYAVCA